MSILQGFDWNKAYNGLFCKSEKGSGFYLNINMNQSWEGQSKKWLQLSMGGWGWEKNIIVNPLLID
jgi:hypothetical protein